MSNNVSAIEIGTNSTKFITVSLDTDQNFRVLEKSSSVNRLSKNMYGKNMLCDEAMEKGIRIIGDYIERSKELDAKLIGIISTSVLRDAENKQVFLSKVKETYDQEIQVISGEQETAYAYHSCSCLAEQEEETIAVIDIGGGSTEFSIGDKNHITEKYSFNIGAVRLTEMFVKHDPMNEEENMEIKQYITSYINKEIDRKSNQKQTNQKQANQKQANPILANNDSTTYSTYNNNNSHNDSNSDSKDYSKDYSCNSNNNNLNLIGTGGTVKTIGTMLQQIDYKDEASVNGVQLTLMEIKKMRERVANLTMEERKSLIGLNPKRADVIHTGMIILISVMESFGIEAITISAQGVIEGYISAYQMSLDK